MLEHLILNGCSLGDDGLEPIANGELLGKVQGVHCCLQLSVATGRW